MVSQDAVNRAIDTMASTLKAIVSEIDVQDIASFEMNSSGTGECEVTLDLKDNHYKTETSTKHTYITHIKNLGHLWWRENYVSPFKTPS